MEVGCIKCLLNSLIEDETDIDFRKAGVRNVALTDTRYDWSPFDLVRTVVLDQLRKVYPDRPDIRSLMAQSM